MDCICVACVGIGYWGKNLVRNFYSIPGGRLKVCCDLNRKALEAIVMQYPGLQVTRDYEQVLADPSIDAVVLAPPADRHYWMAKQALEAGKHTYVEKPLALDTEDADDLCQLAESKGLVLMVGHLLEYHPAVGKLKQVVNNRVLGEIYYLYTQRTNLGIIRQDENALWSLAPHDVSIILYLLGEEPDTVSAYGVPYLQPNIEDIVFCNLRFSNRVMAQIHVSWLDPHKIRRITVVGSEKMAVFDDMETTNKIRIYDKGVDGIHRIPYKPLMLRSGHVTIPEVEMREPLKVECQHFLECIREGKTPTSDGWDGLRVVRVLEAAEKSLKNNGVPVSLTHTVLAGQGSITW